jgi:hypothetical protein
LNEWNGKGGTRLLGGGRYVTKIYQADRIRNAITEFNLLLRVPICFMENDFYEAVSGTL